MTNKKELFSIKYSLALIAIFLATPLVLAMPLIVAQLFGRPIIDNVGLTSDNLINLSSR